MFQKMAVNFIIWFNVALMVYMYAGLNSLYSNWWLEWCLTKTSLIFIMSFFIIIMIYKGGGILAYVHRLIV